MNNSNSQETPTKSPCNHKLQCNKSCAHNPLRQRADVEKGCSTVESSTVPEVTIENAEGYSLAPIPFDSVRRINMLYNAMQCDGRGTNASENSSSNLHNTSQTPNDTNNDAVGNNDEETVRGLFSQVFNYSTRGTCYTWGFFVMFLLFLLIFYIKLLLPLIVTMCCLFGQYPTVGKGMASVSSIQPVCASLIFFISNGVILFICGCLLDFSKMNKVLWMAYVKEKEVELPNAMEVFCFCVYKDLIWIYINGIGKILVSSIHTNEESPRRYLQKRRSMAVEEQFFSFFREISNIPIWSTFIILFFESPAWKLFYFICYGVIKLIETVESAVQIIMIVKAPYLSTKCGKYLPSDQKTTNECCSICYNDYYHPFQLNCGHIFCETCLVMSLEKKASCPLCRQSIKASHYMAFANGSLSSYALYL